MATKIELKVTINCDRCRVDYMKVVAKLQGIDEITVNVEKGTLVVVGTVDPVCVVNQLRKAKKFAKVISVGPNKKPDPPKPKTPEKCKTLPPCCKQCQLVAVTYSYDIGGGCFIL